MVTLASSRSIEGALPVRGGDRKKLRREGGLVFIQPSLRCSPIWRERGKEFPELR